MFREVKIIQKIYCEGNVKLFFLTLYQALWRSFIHLQVQILYMRSAYMYHTCTLLSTGACAICTYSSIESECSAENLIFRQAARFPPLTCLQR